MALKLYDDKTQIPQDQQATAVELKDGKWAVDEPSADLGDAGRQAIAAEREKAANEEKARKKAEKELADLKREAAARASGVTEEQLQKIRTDEAAARAPIEAELATTKAENRKLKLTDRVKALALKHGIMTDRIDDAMVLLDSRTDLGDAGGIIVKGKDGVATAETVDDFLSKTFKTEKPWLYVGPGGSGAGGGGSNGTDAPTAEKTQARTAELRSVIAGAL